MSNLPLNIDIQQILLHMFNFVILVGGLYLILYKPVKDFMDKRTEYYKKMDEEAKAKITEADAVKAQYEEKLAGADEEIAQMKTRVTAEVTENARMREEKAEKEAAEILEKAKTQAVAEHDRMIADARTQIATLAADAAQKLMESDGDEYEQFVQAAGKGK